MYRFWKLFSYQHLLHLKKAPKSHPLHKEHVREPDTENTAGGIQCIRNRGDKVQDEPKQAQEITAKPELYIIFCKVFNEQTKQFGMTQKAVTETIHICKDRNILREYLLDREKEVVSIMMSLFDEEQIMKSFIRSERHDEARETAERMIKMGKLSLDEIALCVPSLSLDELRELETEVMQLA